MMGIGGDGDRRSRGERENLYRRRIQNSGARMDSVRQDGESRLKAPNFNRGSEKILSVTVTPDLGHRVF